MPPVGKIDTELLELAINFLNTKSVELPDCRRWLGQREFSALQKFGHKLSGVAGSYGFEDLTRLGAAMEAAAVNHDATEISDCLQRIEALVAEAKSEIQSLSAIYKQGHKYDTRHSVPKAKKNSKSKFDQMHRAMYDTAAILELTPDGVISAANAKFLELSGYSESELIGQSHSIIVPDSPKARASREALWNRVRGGAFCVAEVERVGKNGNIFWLHGSCSPIYDEMGQFVSVIKIGFDITERKKVENELARARASELKANILKTEFFANVSHEMRTPLYAILAMTELLNDTKLTPEQSDHVETLLRTSNALLRIVDEVLDYSKFENGDFSISLKDCSINEILDLAREAIEARAKAKRLSLLISVDPKVPRRLKVDGSRIEQVLMNLLSNAVKFTESGGITVAVSVNSITGRKGNILFAVSDTGPGMSQNIRKAKFARFSQDESQSTAVKGSGLGLHICKSLVDLMGGEIWIDETSEKGCRVFFTIQADSVAMTAPEVNEVQTPAVIDLQQPSSQSDPLRILLVDDNADNREIFQAFLKNTKHKLQTAENGEEGVARIMSNQYDIVFMDVQMPVMDGLTATRKIRQWEERENRQSTSIVALTAFGSDRHLAESASAGCDRHMIKPLRRKDLFEVLADFSERQVDLANRRSA